MWQQRTTWALYILGAIIYALLCGPAIRQRGYPPIDAAWTAVTFLWIAPILLSMVFDHRSVRRRWKGLCVYAFVTAFFDVASLVGVVPKHLVLFDVLIETIFIFGPLHCLIALFVVVASKKLRLTTRRISQHRPLASFLFSRWVVFSLIVAVTFAFPFLFRGLDNIRARHLGELSAERDWERGEAQQIIDHFPLYNNVRYYFDPATGLEYRSRPHQGEFYRAYSSRVTELLEERGIPSWSMKPYLVPDDKLRDLLESHDFEKITNFPFVTDHFVVSKETFKRESEPNVRYGTMLSIDSKEGSFGFGDSSGPTFIGEVPDYPGVIFICRGRNSIAAFQERGILLSDYTAPDANID